MRIKPTVVIRIPDVELRVGERYTYLTGCSAALGGITIRIPDCREQRLPWLSMWPRLKRIPVFLQCDQVFPRM
jgi:hypothetical protein